jgi:hypothetical protein
MAASMSVFRSLFRIGPGNSSSDPAFSYESPYHIVLVKVSDQEIVMKRCDVRQGLMRGYKRIALMCLFLVYMALPCLLVKLYAIP